MSEREPPVTRFPDDLTARRWRERAEPAAVTIRCARGRQSCDRLVTIYETPGSAVVVFFQSTPDTPTRISAPVDLPADYHPTSHKKFDEDSGAGLLTGWRDERGTAVALEDDDYWRNVVEAGCRRHIGFVSFSRGDLMDYLRRARADRTGRIRVAYRE